MKKGKIFLTALATAVALGVVSQAGAWMRGPMYGPMMGTYNPTVSVEQRQKAQAIEAKYQKQLVDKEAAIRAKATELDAALADGSSTLDKTNALRTELYALEQDYWRLRAQVNQEVGTVAGTGYSGTGYYGPMGWGPGSCMWHDNHYGMYGGSGNMAGPGPMMGYGPGRGWCPW